MAQLADRCTSTVGEDGFGSVELTESVTISNEVAQIAVPCRIKLSTNAKLKLNNVELTSRHLVIRDRGVEARGNTVEINDSTLQGVGSSGFLLQLADRDDWASIHRSTISYPLSVWVRVTGQREGFPGGGRIDVTESTLRSIDPASEGIQLVAGDSNGGRATLTGLTLDSPAEKVLLAEKCISANIVGAPPDCGPLTDGQLANP